MLRPINATILFFRLHIAITIGVYETRVESLYNNLTERRIDKLRENSPINPEGITIRPEKWQGCERHIINALKSRNKNLSFVPGWSTISKKQARLKNHKTHGITSHGSVI